jgi:hypothetical protein
MGAVFVAVSCLSDLVDINAANFGLITATATAAAKSTLHHQFQAQLRFSF